MWKEINFSNNNNNCNRFLLDFFFLPVKGNSADMV